MPASAIDIAASVHTPSITAWPRSRGTSATGCMHSTTSHQDDGVNFSFLDRERTIAPPGYNRYLVPPAALAVHLSIGQVYAFSTFNLPLTRLIGGNASAPGDWTLSEVGWIFSIAIVVLGLSAALFGRWMERVGPRRAMFTAALCFGGGFLVAALGVRLHQLWLIYLGYGVLGGCG